jgi:hypothetical protein
VKEIAKACFLSQQACSSQLLILRDRRFVRVEERGRERYYELKEPLMRLCMEVKSSRGEASSLLVEMLRIWYSEQDLEGLEGMEGMEGLVKGQDRMRAMGLPWNKALEEPQKFQAVTTPIYRIFTAMDNALGEKSNTTSILALPIEERKLVMQMRERVERSKHA